MRPRLAGSTRPAHRPPGQAGRRKGQGCAPGNVLSSGLRRLSPLSPVGSQVYGERVPGSRWSWAALARPVTASDGLPLPDVTDSHAGREWTIDSAAVVLALALGALFLSPELHDTPDPLSAGQIAVDVTRACWRACHCGGGGGGRSPWRSCVLSWARSRPRPPRRVCWRCPRWPCIAEREPPCWSPRCGSRRSCVFAVYSPTTDPATVVLLSCRSPSPPAAGACSSGPVGSCCCPCGNERCGPRPTASCTRSTRGSPNAHASRARCTTSWPTGSR